MIMIRILYPILALLAVLAASPASAAIRCNGLVCKGTDAEWTTLGTPGTYLGIVSDNSCLFLGDGSTAYSTLAADCVPFILSGVDGTMLTGTAGTSGNCVEWNADGDLVDAGAACGVGGAPTTRTITASSEVASGDLGNFVECNSATPITLDIDTDALTWTNESVVYVSNIGAGNCTIQDGSTADVTVNGSNLVVAQWGGVTVKGVNDTTVFVAGTGQLATNDTDIIGSSTVETSDVTVDASDHGTTIVCNHATGMAVNVDDGAPDWSPDYRIYVTNIGAGDCTIQDGSTADVTIRTPTGFTAVVPQYGGATIIGKDVDEVIVTGGEAS